MARLYADGKIQERKTDAWEGGEEQRGQSQGLPATVEKVDRGTGAGAGRFGRRSLRKFYVMMSD